MAQWDFVVSWEDIWFVLDLIVHRPGTDLVHDLWYKSNTLTCYSSLNVEAQNSIKARSSLYVRGDDFSKLPVDMHVVGESDPDPLFVVSSNIGGPLLQLSIRGEYHSKGKPIIPSSMLSYPDEYMNMTTGEWLKPSAELKAAYKDIQRLMKQGMVRHKGQRGFVWIGKNAFELLRSGRAKTSFFGLVF